MLKIVSRSERRVPAATHRAERRAVLDDPALVAVVPDEVRDPVHVRVRPGRDRGEADRRQRREHRDRPRVARRARPGRPSAGASPLSTARSKTAGVRPSMTIRTRFFPDTVSPWRGCVARRTGPGRGGAAAGRTPGRRPPRRSRPPGRTRGRATTEPASANSIAMPERVPPPRSVPRRPAPSRDAPSSPPIRPADRLRPVADQQADPDPGRDGEQRGDDDRTPVRPSGMSAPIATPAPCRCRPRRRSSTRSPSRASLGGFSTFQPADHGKPELRRACAVDHPVVEGDRDRPGRTDDDLAVARRPGAVRSGRC